MTKAAPPFHGLYQGVVVSNTDPLRTGRLLVRVADVLGDDPCVWAQPATPLAGPASGMYVVPLVNSGVWVQFAEGDPDRAVWTGFWRGGSAELPPAAQAAPDGTPQVVIGTPAQTCLLLSDLGGPTGGILLQLKGPAGPYIRLHEGGIEIGASAAGPTIKVTQAGIDLGNGALTVLPG
ncbi:phage baseplate assembly protein V [Streptomyces sp. NPDC089799]|uniref:phage baseplate assembly protein V n=1 Tax=Streptomyces sp. NPDC089799 TaxID=3155066 RepID=UPI0034441E3D